MEGRKTEADYNLEYLQVCNMASKIAQTTTLFRYFILCTERYRTMIANFSNRLRELRQRKGLRQEQVAKLIGVNKSAISTYENDIRQPSFEILVRLANLYRVSTDYLLGQTNIRSVDLSGLTEEEASYICGLVELMSKKNEKINSL